MPGADRVGQIESVSVKWKLSVAMSSSEVKNLNAPMVTMVLTTMEENGTSSSRCIEMTVAEFEDLHAKMQNVRTQMEQAKLL